MPEHTHNLGQGFNVAHMEEYVWCIECKQKWSKAEVQAAINATERLSAEDAHTIAVLSRQGAYPGGARSLLDYASALEGKDA